MKYEIQQRVNVLKKDILKEAKVLGVKVKLSKKGSITYPTDGGDGIAACNGYFNDSPKELACAVGLPLHKWLVTLIHESCHMDQWNEGIELWDESAPALTIIDAHLAGDKSYSWYQLTTAFRIAIAMERDCEIRSVKKLQDYKLTNIISSSEYIQKANAYLYFYGIILRTKKWYSPGKEPYNIKSIWSKLPNRFQGVDSYLHPSTKITKLYLDNGIK